MVVTSNTQAHPILSLHYYFLISILMLSPHLCVWVVYQNTNTDVFFSKTPDTGIGAYLASSSITTGALSPGLKRPVSEANHSPLFVPRLIIDGAIPLFPPICFYGLERENFSCTFCQQLKYIWQEFSWHSYSQFMWLAARHKTYWPHGNSTQATVITTNTIIT